MTFDISINNLFTAGILHQKKITARFLQKKKPNS